MAIAVSRGRRAEEEGESVFVSMTDLTVSFLFILLILLAFFATQLRTEDMVSPSEHGALKRQLEDELVSERERLYRVEQERFEFAGRLASAERTIAELSALVAAHREELAAATAANDELHAEIEARRREFAGRLASAERTIAELSALVAAHREELAAATAANDELHAEIEARRREFELMSNELDIAGARLADLRKVRDRLRAQLFEMEGPDSLAAYFDNASKAREALLKRLADQVHRTLPAIQVSVNTTDGVIRFRADELFPIGTWRIPPGSLAERVSHAVGDALAETLPCYTLSPDLDIDVSCEGIVAAIETIQIEGHTDDVALSAELQRREQMRDNYDLSARRGAETLRVMTSERPALRRFLNLQGYPVLSFAGYGETRPINQDDTDEARAQNRRIDIRFILETPRNLLQVKEIRSQLTRRRADLPIIADEPSP